MTSVTACDRALLARVMAVITNPDLLKVLSSEPFLFSLTTNQYAFPLPYALLVRIPPMTILPSGWTTPVFGKSR